MNIASTEKTANKLTKKSNKSAEKETKLLGNKAVCCRLRKIVQSIRTLAISTKRLRRIRSQAQIIIEVRSLIGDILVIFYCHVLL